LLRKGGAQDFDIITENGKHLGPTGEFSPSQFRDMMRAELWRYSRRQLANVLSVSGDEQFRSTILMLKILETSMHASFEGLAAARANLSGGEAQGAGGGDSGVAGARAVALHEVGGRLEQLCGLVHAQAADITALRTAHSHVSSLVIDLTQRLEQAGVIPR